MPGVLAFTERVKNNMEHFGIYSYMFFGIALTSLMCLVLAWYCFLVNQNK